jgi:hypothetical protein
MNSAFVLVAYLAGLVVAVAFVRGTARVSEGDLE